MQVESILSRFVDKSIGAEQIVPTGQLIVDMVQTVYSPAGVRLQAKTRQTLDYDFGAWVITNNYGKLAPDGGNWPALSEDVLSSFGIAAEAAGVNYRNSGAVNARAFNRILARGGIVTLTRPGQYFIAGEGEDGLLAPNNTTVVLGKRVELILGDQAFCPIIRGKDAFDAGTALTGPIVYGGAGGSFTGTCPAPGIHLKHPVGSWIAVLGLDLTNANNRTYQGVYKVISVGADTITYEMVDIPPSGGNSTAGAIVYPANINIEIVGGLWDGNWANNVLGNPYSKGDPHQWIICTRNTWNTRVSDIIFRKGQSWCAGANNVRDATWRNLSGDLFALDSEATVMFQGTGGARNVLVENLSGTCADNMASWSLDVSGVYTNQWNGDVYDLKFRNIASQANNATILNLWGNTSARFHSVEIDGVYGRTNSNAVAIDNGFLATSLLNTRGGVCKIKNVDASFNGIGVEFRSDGDWDSVEIDGVQQRRSTNISNPLVRFNKRSGGTVQTIRKVDIKNVNHYQPGSTINRTGAMVQISDSNITDLTVGKIPVTRINADIGLVTFSGVEGVVAKAFVSEVNGTANSSGDRTLVRCANTGVGSLGQLTLRDSTFTAFDASGGLAQQTATGIVAGIRVDNNTFTNARAGNVSGVLRDGAGLLVTTINTTTV